MGWFAGFWFLVPRSWFVVNALAFDHQKRKARNPEPETLNGRIEMGWFESLRKWIDGEEDIDEQGQVRARSKWDDFLVTVAREIEQCMQREMFTPPGGPTYVPREYIVFMSTTDDADWQGE